MTSTTKARSCQTPAARQKRVWDKSAPSYDKQIASFEKIQFGGGREWLGERAGGRVLEVAIRAAGEHFTRRQLPFVQAAGFQIVETERLKAGTVERIHAVKPT
jgi:hypothetical protein